MTGEILRPLSTGELLDKTFSLYRSHFWIFVTIMAVPALIGMAMELVTSGLTPVAPLAGLSGVFLMPMYFIVYLFAMAATVFAVAGILKGTPISARKAYELLRGKRWRLLNVSAWIGVLCLLGFFLFILPGIMLAMRYSLSIPAAVIENLNGRKALKRSRLLIKGYVGRVYVITALGIILAWVGMLVFQAPFQLVQAVYVKDGALPLWLSIPSSVGTFVAGALTGPLAMIALSLVYYDMRVRKEGYDLQMMMEALDQKADAAAVSASTMPASPSP